MKVAVYGTLKKGYGNNMYLENSVFIQDDIVDNYKLYHAGFPVSSPNEGTKIMVQVFEVLDEETMGDLDALEGYRGEGNASNMYDRKPVVTVGGHECQMYVGNPLFWRQFQGMKECPIEDGVYEWHRY